MKIGILNGPNLNRLGLREPEVYGSLTLDDLQKMIKDEAVQMDIDVDFYQSNHEGDLVDKIHEWADSGYTGVIANPGAYTHTSVALRDAYSSTTMKFVEVHISNIYKREDFRHTSYTAPICDGVITGLGFYGYIAALNYMAEVSS